MDVVAVIALSYLLGSVWFTCAFLTGVAAYRRGIAVLPALLAGVCFPVAWTVWYLRAERRLRVA
ncbi:hypothetical protein [Nocardioides sp. InS609-2]|uniref:hypothetical protein n=1 Tax=Nocardioides sp. InS609-2 TaxID=2760705 RepID=UPI0020BF1C17|nr:hypothetical protein [Nocardioides sp. InS609-2]